SPILFTFNIFLLSSFFHDMVTTEFYTLSLHDALPICIYEKFLEFNDTDPHNVEHIMVETGARNTLFFNKEADAVAVFSTNEYPRSEEHTSELQSRENLVCRLLLEKKKKNKHAVTNAPV